jgi:hypothetical protein
MMQLKKVCIVNGKIRMLISCNTSKIPWKDKQWVGL